MKKTIDHVCQWYCDFFGTETAFAFAVLICAAWGLLVLVLGYSRWNSGPGLLGNTVESTLELFFEIAILVVARRVDKSAQRQQTHMAEQVNHMETILMHLDRAAEQGKRILTNTSVDMDQLNADLQKLADLTPGVEARQLARRIGDRLNGGQR